VSRNKTFGRALLVACDAMSYGSGDDQLQDAMQDGLIKVLDEAAAEAHLVRSQWARNSTGDGELALLPMTESEPQVVDDFVRELAAALAVHNRHLRDDARLRLRVAIDHGVAYPSSNGYAGQGVVAVNRLLDCAQVRDALRLSGADVAVIVSSRVYEDTVAQGHTSLPPGAFRKVAVRVKEFEADAWIWVPAGDVHVLPLVAQAQSPDEAAAGPSAAGTPGAGPPAAGPQTAIVSFHEKVFAPGAVFGIGADLRRSAEEQSG
jgi:hypothetical protein